MSSYSDTEKGWVYLCKPEGKNVYKIGETINLQRRFAEKQKKIDYKLILVACIEVERELLYSVEYRLHETFKRYRLAGEWFALPDSIQIEFLDYAKPAYEYEKNLAIARERLTHEQR